MRTIISVLFVSIFIAGSFAYYTDPSHFKNADNDVLHKQAFLLEILQHPHQHGEYIYKPEYLNIVKSFNFENYYDHFSNQDAVKEFYYLYQHHPIPYYEEFSIHDKLHRQHAIALFHVFHYAKGEFFSKTFYFSTNFFFIFKTNFNLSC